MKVKYAIGYVRKSKKDQSNFSLEFQDSLIRGFNLTNEEISMVKVFVDDGFSAKNFDRTDWKELEKFIKENHRNIDYFIVAKYDRFGRNLLQCLQKIELIENKYDIRILSVLEYIGLHPDSPYFFKTRTDMLTSAQTEWMQIRERTKFGIRQAKIGGRVVNRAALGYKNARDEKNLPIIVIDEVKAPFIRSIYELYLNGLGATEIFSKLKSEGFRLKSKTNVMKILANPIYAGLIRVQSLYDQPEQLVKGIHLPIVPENTWWRVQGLLTDRPKNVKIKLDERFPLRGILSYTNGKLFTSYYAQGKKNKVPYYRVFKPDKSFNANKLHEMMDEILQTLSLSPIQVEYLKSSVLRELEVQNADNYKLIDKRRNELQQYLVKMNNINEDRAERIMDAETYRKLHYQYSLQIQNLENDLNQLETPNHVVLEKCQRTLPLLVDLKSIYNMAGLEAKQAILKMVFDKGISYDGDIYRTPEVYPFFRPKAALLKEKRLLEIEQPLVNLSQSDLLYRVRESNP
ncbi:recombinase family protein [Niabella sp. 22666]|uniref:recombinase family protein n=1 Tax=Niabella sp. 22666 TaxID=3453954 RepID=UPI003F84603F